MSFVSSGNLDLRIIKEENGVACIELKGRLDSTNANDLDIALLSLINEGVSNIILSCEALRYVSSAGLGVFLKAFKQISKQDNGHFLLCAVAENIKRVLKITGFADFIPIYNDYPQARRQLQKEEGL